jgi:molybdate transport system substrate-binding protein
MLQIGHYLRPRFMQARPLRLCSVLVMALGLAGAPARAAEITLLGSAALDVILEEVVPDFSRLTGHKVAMRLDYASLLRREIASGAAFDVAILVGELDDLVAQGRIASGTPVALGRSAYGLAVRKGAPKPDIATADAFKRTLLGATSVGYARDGGSGAYFVRLLERLGIAEAMKPRLRPGATPQEAVAKGEIEMSVSGIVPILRTPGVELAGPLPDDLQSYSTFVAGLSAATREQAAAAALLSHLTSPAVTAVFRKRGVLPVP